MSCYTTNGDYIDAKFWCADAIAQKRTSDLNTKVGVRGETQLKYYCTPAIDNLQQCTTSLNGPVAKHLGQVSGLLYLSEENAVQLDKLPHLPNYQVQFCPIPSQKMLPGLCSDHANEFIVDYGDLSTAVINVKKLPKTSNNV
jgi:hypothetical protein